MALVTSAAASLKNTWGFSPQSIPGLQLWLDAADSNSITGTSSVTAWRNKGAAGGSASTTNGTISSSGSINSRPALSIGSQARMTLPSLTFAQTSRTVFYVVTIGNSNNFYLFLDGSINNRDINSTIFNGTNYLYMSPLGTEALVAAFPSFNSTSIISGVSAPASNRGLYVNGTALTLITDSGGTYTTGTTTTQVTGNAIYQAPYTLGEMMIFDGALTTQQQQQVEGYLASKWGLKANLPATHPYSATASVPFNRPFYPTDIPGCALWLDAADSSTITGTSSVTVWRDKSGTGNNATTANGTPALTTTGTTQFIRFPNLTRMQLASILNAPPTVFLVGKVDINTNSTAMVGVPTNTVQFAGFYLQLGTSGPPYPARYQVSPTTSTFETATSTFPGLNTLGILTGIYDSTNATSGQKLSTNGTLGTTDAGGSQLALSGTFVGNVDWFQGGFTNPGGNVDLCEIITFNSVLTSAQQQQVEQYLTWKWGLPTANLPTGHPGRLLPAFSTPFTPKSITGCALWLDAADTSTITGTSSVTAWRDKSGNANNATGNGSPVNNIRTQNGSPLIGLESGGDYFFVNNSFDLATFASITYVCLIRNTGSQSGKKGILSTNVSGQFGRSLGTDGNNFDIETFNTFIPTTESLTAGGLYIAVLVFNGSTSTMLSINGRQTTYSGFTTSGINTNTGFYIGTYDDGGNRTTYNANIDIAEVLVYGSVLNTSQVQQVEGYLAWKWGLQRSLPSTHAYAKFSP